MQVYDLVIAGAGIHGAGVAQAAAARGWQVLVIEKREAAGLETSSNSSKLIHGGLRYLETGQFALVRECLRERQLLLRNAPDLVRLQRFYLPLYDTASRPSWKLAVGLKLYDLLAGRAGPKSFKVPRHEWSRLPIKQQGLRAVFGYYDGQTDDRALTQAVLQSAVALGAKVHFTTTVQRVEQVDGAMTVYLGEGEPVQTRAFVNAAGAWANVLASRVEGAVEVEIDWVQGVHLLLDIPAFSGCFYFEAADGRAVFVLPWRGKTMVGTTERILSEPTAAVTEVETEYLLQTFNQHFPEYHCDISGIIQTFVGMRVLPKAAAAANSRSRETILLERRLAKGLYVAIYGGKLTSYRATAERVAQRLTKLLGQGSAVQDTAEIRLTGAGITP